MKKYYAHTIVSALLLLGANFAYAQLSDFTQNPTTNSTDWAAEITNLGGTVNSNVNFETHPVGPLQSGFYALSDGVTLTATGGGNDVRNGAGPNDGNTSSPPLSPGEGPHAASNYLWDDSSPFTLVISFNAPQWGAGLFTIDHFNPSNDDGLTIEAFDGPDGTGNSLGIVNSAAFNYQPNNLYFMGVTSSLGNIRSIVFSDILSATGDRIGLDDILFAPADTFVAVPVPATGLISRLLLIMALLLVGSWGLRRFQA